MTKEQEEAIEMLEDIKNNTWTTKYIMSSDSKKAETVLNMLKEKDRQIDLIKKYAHQEIEHYTETIEDYMDDDKEGNKNYIKELKEKREHWKDIERILKNKPEELYMNWWKYGLYE
jgi:hypothetical protein